MGKLIRVVFFLPFILGGIFAIIMGIKTYKSDKEFFKEALPVEAHIDDIITKTKTSGTGRKKTKTTTHDVFVSYTVNGVDYKGIEINEYSSSMSEGGTVVLYYNPDNPKEIKCKEVAKSAPVVAIVVGVVFVIVGSTTMFVFKEPKTNKKLKKSGIKYTTNEFYYTEKTNVTCNGRHPLYVTCVIRNPHTGAINEYRSDMAYPSLDEKNIREFDVYVDANDSNKGYVDVITALEIARKGGLGGENWF